ncbi:MAG: hypothetical protein RL662_701 [Bacteroidota bacterium]|jgi:TonB-linked SusC/RagA family outer membrane protein
MKKSLFFILMCLLALQVSAQNRQLKGTVVDVQGEPLIGASVQSVGGQGGTMTDIDGNFSLSVSNEIKAIDVNYLGYKSQRVNVVGKTEVKITLDEDKQVLSEVVVTALGIKRDKKALGYQVQDVSGEALSKVQSVSPLAALSGTISGLNVSSSGTGPGGSVKVQLRGANSISGNNEPLYVIDGVPLDNSGLNDGAGRGFDYGNAANNINPDDIENISVLKGGAAAALYGSRGQNGVIMITTKQGKKGGKLEVSLKSSFTFSNPMSYPELQNDYAQGSGGKHTMSEVGSWGPKMTGQEYTNFLGQKALLNRNTENPFKEFFKTGTNLSNTVSVSKGLEGGSFYMSVSDLKSKGLAPNEKFDKLSLTGRFTYDLTKYLNIDAKVNFISQDANNRPRLLENPDNVMHSLYSMPRSININQLAQYSTSSGYPVIYTKEYTTLEDGTLINRNGDANYQFASTPYVQNPYWATNLSHNEDFRKRTLSYVKLDLNIKEIFPSLPLDKLNLMGRAGIDYYTDRRKNYEYNRTVFKPGGTAPLEAYQGESSETNFDFLLSGFKQVNDFGLSASVGGNLRKNASNSISGFSGAGIINPDGNYVINNFNDFKATEGVSRKEIQSFYGMFTLDYKSMLFLDLTARNDWSSALDPSLWSFFYPSASFSWIASQTFQLPEVVNYLKFRTSWAGVGNDMNPHQLDFLYVPLPGRFHNLPFAGISTTNPNRYIKAEQTQSFEIGVESRLLKNRLSVDFSYYQTGTKNQIFNAPSAPSSGFEKARVNAGHISNRGLELSLKGNVIETKDLKVGMLFNISRNYAKLEELNEDIDVLTVAGFPTGSVQVRVGQEPGLLVGSAYQRDDAGKIMLDSKNLPMKKLTQSGSIDTDVVLGSSIPKWLSGFGINADYKGFLFDIFLDGKFGHNLYSYSNAYGSKMGTLASTVAGRDEWALAKELSAQTGLASRDIGGKAVHGSKNGVVGTYYVDPQEYFERLSEITEEYVYDASFIRLQRISLGYRFAGGWVKKIGAKDISVSLIASNLVYLMKHTPNIMPNTAFASGTFGAGETLAYPETRSIGASIGITF